MSGLTLWVCALGLVAALALGITEVGAAAIADAQATTAADAAALAGAAAGADAAHKAAVRNGAELRSIDVRGDVTTVVVAVGEASATAHARRIVVPVS